MAGNYQKTEIDSYARCEHCGKEVVKSDAVINNGLAFCCTGCLGVSNLIHSLGLGEYYSVKDYEKHGNNYRGFGQSFFYCTVRCTKIRHFYVRISYILKRN